MFWKLVKYELQSVRKWYLGIYGIAILLSIPLGLMLQKLMVTFEHSHKEPSLLFMAFFSRCGNNFFHQEGTTTTLNTVELRIHFISPIYSHIDTVNIINCL